MIWFKDGTDIYFARQLVNERLQEAKIKIASWCGASDAHNFNWPCGETRWTVKRNRALNATGEPYSATEWARNSRLIVKPQLRNAVLPRINTIVLQQRISGRTKTRKLVAHDVTWQEVAASIENNANIGAGHRTPWGTVSGARAPGQLSSIADIKHIIVEINP